MAKTQAFGLVWFKMDFGQMCRCSAVHYGTLASAKAAAAKVEAEKGVKVTIVK